jgi:hypothetical protein
MILPLVADWGPSPTELLGVTHCDVPQHAAGPLGYVCRTCETLACESCILDRHTGHSVVSLTESAEVARAELRSSLETLGSSVEFHRKLAAQCRRDIETLAESFRNVSVTLYGRYDALVGSLHRTVDSLLGSAHTAYKVKKAALLAALASARTAGGWLRTLVEAASAALESGDDLVVIHLARSTQRAKPLSADRHTSRMDIMLEWTADDLPPVLPLGSLLRPVPLLKECSTLAVQQFLRGVDVASLPIVGLKESLGSVALIAAGAAVVGAEQTAVLQPCRPWILSVLQQHYLDPGVAETCCHALCSLIHEPATNLTVRAGQYLASCLAQLPLTLVGIVCMRRCQRCRC